MENVVWCVVYQPRVFISLQTQGVKWCHAVIVGGLNDSHRKLINADDV